jgi:hypothetical protein
VTCTIEDCDRRATARGWCKLHYNRWQRTGSTELKPRHHPRICTVDGCNRHHSALGMCAMHRNRFLSNGTTEPRDPHEGDKRAIAYYTGVIDARNDRPRRVDIAGDSLIARLYRRGYDTISPPAEAAA